MSLDVYLTLENAKPIHNCSGPGIFIREGGQTKEISRSEWDEKFPGREPIIAIPSEDEGEVYSANITHNLNTMADKADLYWYLWRPRRCLITKAYQLIMPLRVGLRTLEANPERFTKYLPPHGWGDYEGLVEFTRDYLKACEEYPDADVFASR